MSDRPDQLIALAQPFPPKLIKKPAPGKHGDYVKHSTINERLLHELGGFSFEVVEVIRGLAPEMKTEKNTYAARDNAVVGVLGRLTVTVDGVERIITEVGSEDNPAMSHDGDNLKNAASDALKRCAMRLGVGLHLWSGDAYYLDTQLKKLWAYTDDSPANNVTVTAPTTEPTLTNTVAPDEVGLSDPGEVPYDDEPDPPHHKKAKKKTPTDYENAAKSHVLGLVNNDKSEAALAWPLVLEKARVEKVGTKKEYEAVVRAANDTLGAE